MGGHVKCKKCETFSENDKQLQNAKQCKWCTRRFVKHVLEKYQGACSACFAKYATETEKKWNTFKNHFNTSKKQCFRKTLMPGRQRAITKTNFNGPGRSAVCGISGPI